MTTRVAAAAVDVRPFGFPLGAEVVCDLRALDEVGRRVIRQAWLDNLVLLFRGQNLTPDELLTFARIFGEVDRAASIKEMPEGQKDRFNPYISVVSNIKEDGVAIGSLGHGEVVWHSDHSYHEVPLSASMLVAVEIPPSGGQTGFVNMYQALNTLPADVQARLPGLTIKNDATYNSAGQIRRGMSPVTDVTTSPGVNHPVVRTHPETGHNALYLGRRPHAYVNGLTVAESERLLDQLWDHMRALPAWYHDWRVGDVVIWDNRCVMHRRTPFDAAERRLLYRAQCKGTRPAYDAGATRAPHPRSLAGTGHR